MDSYSAIVTLTGGVAPVVSGGGRGQKAALYWRDTTFEARGVNRAAALDALRASVQAWNIAYPEPEPLPRVAVRNIELADEAAPVAKPKGQGSPRACDVSCLFAHRASCVCQCNGQNHQTGWLLFDEIAGATSWADEPKRTKDGRACACGCGGMTRGGHFIQGHDRKFHAALVETVDTDRYFRSEDSVGLVMTPAGRAAVKKAKAAQ